MKQIFKKWICGIFSAALIFLSSGVSGQSLTLSIPDTAYIKGQLVKLPVRISAVSVDQHVLSGQFSITSSNNILSVQSVDASGTLLNGKTVLFNPAAQSFAFSSVSDVVGSGVLIYLNVLVYENASGQTTVSLTNAKLNEGNPDIVIDPGIVRIKSIAISPKSPPNNLVVGDELQFTASGDGVAPFTWTSQNTTAATVSSSGKMTGLNVGSTKIFVTDSQGLSDSTVLFPIHSASLKSLTIGLRDTSFQQTLEFNYPVYVSDVSALEITSAAFSFNYNSNYLTAVDVVTQGSLSDGWMQSFKIENGKISVTIAGSTALSGSGILAFVRVKVQPSVLGQSAVGLSDVLFNETVLATIVNAKFTALAAPVITVEPNIGILTIGDKKIFSVKSGGTAPYQWSVNNSSVAEINSQTGELTAISRGSVVVTATDSKGFKGNSGVFTVNSIRAEIPESTVLLGQSVNIPINLEDVTGLNIVSFLLTVGFDTTKFSLGEIANGSLTDNYTLSHKFENGILTIAGAGAEALLGSGSIVSFDLQQKQNVTAGDSTLLDLKTLTFNEPGNATPTATLVDGKLKVLPIAIFPDNVDLISPINNFLVETDSVQLIWLPSQPNILHYVVEYTTNVNSFDGAVIVETTDTSLWIHDLTDEASYRWRVRAVNPFGESENAEIGAFDVNYVNVSVHDEFKNTSFDLSQNYPNPFNPTTVISYRLSAVSDVRLVVFDLLGREVAELVNTKKEAGIYSVEFDAKNFPSGIYIYQLKSGNQILTKKMILIK